MRYLWELNLKAEEKEYKDFYLLPNLTIEKVWLPIIQELIANYFQNEKLFI